MQPLVSVVTPAFNAERTIGETIRSVLAQSFTDIEHLVVDDCSRDSTTEIVQALSTADPRVRLLRRKANGGPAQARNTALYQARGRFIAFLDSDDLWLPGKLEHQLVDMQALNAPITFTSYKRIDEAGIIVSGVVPVPSHMDYGAALKNTAIATSTAIVDRALTGSFEMQDNYYDDYVLWLSLLKRGFVARGLPHASALYRVRGGSWSRNKLHSASKIWSIYRDVEHLPFSRAALCFANYALRAVVKYSR